MTTYVVIKKDEGMLKDCDLSQPGMPISNTVMTTKVSEAWILQSDAAVTLAGTLVPHGFDFMPESIAREVYDN